LEYLKKTEEQEDRECYARLATNSYVYVQAYRDCIDRIASAEHELWKIAMHPNTENNIKVTALREIHSTNKTCVLLLRDFLLLLDSLSYMI